MQQLTIRYFDPSNYSVLVQHWHSWPREIELVLDSDSQTLMTTWDLACPASRAVSMLCPLPQAGQRLPADRQERMRQVAKVINGLLDKGRVLAQPTSGQSMLLLDLPGRLVVDGAKR